MEVSYLIEKDIAGLRIDRTISLLDSEVTRSYAQKLVEGGHVSIDGKTITANSFKPVEGQSLCIDFPEPEALEILAEDIPLDIIYEDNDLLIINKPKGMVVHPAPGHLTGTLVNALLYHCKDSLSGIGGMARPGIVHRIDRDTTGLLVVCKNDHAHLSLSKQLAEHSITRKYYAIVHGVLKNDGTVDAPLARHPNDRKKMAVVSGGRRAVTHFHVIERLRKDYTFIECQLETGRTHQIRVHMASLHHPLLGDTVYGRDKQPYDTCGQVLHAGILGFVHPTTGEYVEYCAPLPEYFDHLLMKLKT